MLLCDHYITPTTLDEAFDAMDAYRGRYRIVAGATDILPWAREGRAGDVHYPALIDISRIPEMTARKVTATQALIGAATPIQRFMDDPALARALPSMPRCAVWFADDQIRALATIGGNVVNASPAADSIPCLIAQDAVVGLAARRDGRLTRRKLRLDDYMTGPGKTCMAQDELLLAIECTALPGYGGSFEKVGHRRSLVISVVCLAAVVKLDPEGRRVEDVRLALAGVRPVPCRLPEAEALLRGQPLTAERIEAAAHLRADLVQSRSRQDYRRDVIPKFIVRGLVNAARRAGAHPSALDASLEAAYA